MDMLLILFGPPAVIVGIVYLLVKSTPKGPWDPRGGPRR